MRGAAGRDLRPLRVGGLSGPACRDWPGRRTAAVHCQGCLWNCTFCRTPRLRPSTAQAMLPWQTALTILEGWHARLDGVVFKGGEPTSQDGLAIAMAQVRALGLAVCLHSTGACPDRLALLLPLLDRVQLQLKGPFSAYPRITGVPGSGEAVTASLSLLKASGVPFEVRTTTHPALLTCGEIDLLTTQLVQFGVTNVRRLPLCPADRPPAPNVTIWST